MKEKTIQISLLEYQTARGNKPSKSYICRLIRQGKTPPNVISVKKISNSYILEVNSLQSVCN